MATELKSDAWHRYMLYQADDRSLPTFASNAEKQQATEAGKQFVLAAYPDIWARDAGLIQRVRGFLACNFPGHRRLAQSGTDLAAVQTLQAMVRAGSVLVIPEAATRSGGILVSNASAANTPSYTDMDSDEIGEMLACVHSILYPPGEPVLPGPYDPATRGDLMAAAKEVMGSSSLADTVGGDGALIMTALGVSEDDEARCFAEYELEMDICSLKTAMLGGDPRVYLQCSQQAFSNYQHCRGY